jgi:hypothetical protein
VADPIPEAEPDQLIRALSRAARYGRYFEAGRDGDVPAFDIDASLAAVGSRLGATEQRVAASSLQYEFAERVWSVSLGAWAFGRVVPDLTGLRHGTDADGTVVLGFKDLRGWNCLGIPAGGVAALLAHNVLGHLSAFHEAVRTRVKIADGLLWGNAATALVLAARSAGRARSCFDIASALLAEPPLAGRLTGSISVSMRRRTCCLYYRTAAGRTCSDCPL